MDLIEAQTIVSYLKANRNRVELHVPQLERIVEWCDNRKACPERAIFEQIGQEARLLVERVKGARAVLRSRERRIASLNRRQQCLASPSRQGPHIKRRTAQEFRAAQSLSARS